MDCHRAKRTGFVVALAIASLWAAIGRTQDQPSVAGPTSADQSTATAPPAAASVAEPTPTTRAMRYDAALADICIRNEVLGWAVGDRGVIWHTEDGGANWAQQASPVSCHLSAVCFIDGQRGWAVGGESRPGATGSSGVVLRTDDGGKTWTQLPRLLLPRLAGVKFFDRDHGVAFGDCGSFTPSGLFSTRDGGNTWQALPTDKSGDWLAGDFLDAGGGAVAGPGGRIATLTGHKVVNSPLASESLRSFRAMRLAAPTAGWAVGDGGLLMQTNDLGRSWQTPPTDLPDGIADNFDFHAVAIEGSHVWVAGSPGTRIFHSPDGGKSWEAAVTGQFAPLRALTFVDAEHGWAVGDLGSILTTHDGGTTWQVARTGGQRAAMLALFANPMDVPLELLADTAAADGYITAINILYSDAPTTGSGQSSTAVDARQSQEALLLAGAAAAGTTWRFPLPPADLALAPSDLLAALNRENDGRALQQLESHLVRELRMWRPDVVLTQHTQGGLDQPQSSGINALAEQLILQAIAAAADATKYPELSASTGLAPWQVKKVYGVLPTGGRGDEVVAAARFSPWLGAALSDYVSPARRLLAATQSPPADTYELKLLSTNVVDTGNAHGLFNGISLAPGSEARRPQADLPTQDLEALRQLATKRRHLQELMERSEGNAAWAGQVSTMIDGLSADDGGQLLAQLADGYRKTGRLDLAADTYYLLARRYPDHPLVDQSLGWLVQFYASSETALSIGNRANRNARPAVGGDVASADGASSGAPGTQFKNRSSASAVQQAAASMAVAPEAPQTGGLTRDDRLRRAVQLADYLKTARPALYAEPSVRFAETTAQRELGFGNPAQRFYITMRDFPEADPWRECAASEEWLAKPADAPPAKKIAACRLADQAPNLDGILDEPFWTKADRIRLTDKSNEAKTAAGAEVQLARDGQFLYIAARCRKVPSVDYKTNKDPRPHDADLTQHDRITLQLDTDRDYGTAFQLTFDNRGWTSDACWGNPNWNPTWYVAASDDTASWTVEAAIPLAELTEKPPTARHVWAVSACRTIPRVGYQTWTSAATSEPSPAQFGLLIFE